MFNPIFNGPSVSLEEMMAAREGRTYRQRSLLEQYAGTILLSMTMNIPGPVKTSTVLNETFNQMINKIEHILTNDMVFSRKLEAPTGWEYYLVTHLSSLELKQKLITLEEISPIGRLFDLDVIQMSNNQVKPISRSDLGLPPRKCFVCSAVAKECSRSRKHSIEDMQEAISNILNSAV